MGVSLNGDTPKWMVKIMENPMAKWMIWGETHHFRKPSHRNPVFFLGGEHFNPNHIGIHGWVGPLLTLWMFVQRSFLCWTSLASGCQVWGCQGCMSVLKVQGAGGVMLGTSEVFL